MLRNTCGDRCYDQLDPFLCFQFVCALPMRCSETRFWLVPVFLSLIYSLNCHIVRIATSLILPPFFSLLKPTIPLQGNNFLPTITSSKPITQFLARNQLLSDSVHGLHNFSVHSHFLSLIIFKSMMQCPECVNSCQG